VSAIRVIASVCSLIVLACAHGGAARPGPRVTDANTQIVGFVWPSEITAPLSSESWRRSPWFRDEDMVAPSRVVISTARYACILRDGDTRDPRPTQPFTCQNQWRYPRNRGR
jgi:hypothetical protein